MLGFAGLLCAFMAGVLMLVGLVPLLGWLNWFALFFAAAAMGLGVLSRKPERAGEPPRGAAGAFAIVIALGVMLVALLRLAIGGGIL